jgi:bacterioferritin
MKQSFKADLETIRRNAREKMAEGAVTAGYLADRTKVIDVLNDVLATEIVCTLRYRSHYFMASGIFSKPVADEFLAHANEEQLHVDSVAARITQLGGIPNFNPVGLATRSHSEYGEVARIEDMIRDDLVAERIAIQTYSEIIRWLENDDVTTRRLMESILKVEEEHADDMKNLLEKLSK